MTPGILSRLFAAQQPPQQGPPTGAQEPQWGPNPYADPNYGVPQGQLAMSQGVHPGPRPRPQQQAPMGPEEPLTLEQEPGDLWGNQGLDVPGEDMLPGMMQQAQDAPMPPTGMMQLDRVEQGDDGYADMGVMMDPETEDTQNFQMGALPQDLKPGGYAFPPSPPGPLETMYRSPAFGGRMTSR